VNCPNCGHELVPPEPPLGSWVRDRHGAVVTRHIDQDGNDGWSPGPGFLALAKWRSMWRARGPLTPCGPYGEGGKQ
jgi:hypothetical protein